MVVVDVVAGCQLESAASVVWPPGIGASSCSMPTPWSTGRRTRSGSRVRRVIRPWQVDAHQWGRRVWPQQYRPLALRGRHRALRAPQRVRRRRTVSGTDRRGSRRRSARREPARRRLLTPRGVLHRRSASRVRSLLCLSQLWEYILEAMEHLVLRKLLIPVACERARPLGTSHSGTATTNSRDAVSSPSAHGLPSPVRYAKFVGFMTNKASMPCVS